MTPDELLGQVTIPSPCAADWDSMEGDNGARFCRECGKSVVNFRGISKEEAARLVAERGDDLCARITRSKSGSVITRPALAPLRYNLRSMISLIAWIAAMMGFLRFILTQPMVVAGGIRRCPPPATALPTPTGIVQVEGCGIIQDDGEQEEDGSGG